MQAARDIFGKLAEKALLPLYYGMGLSGALVSMLAELFAIARGRSA
jgi:hypothetical protein